MPIHDFNTPYLSGFNAKPSQITILGQVLFTDGTYEFMPTQSQCEAYGYNYDITTGTCTTFKFSTKIAQGFLNESNILLGSINTVQQGTTNTQIIGENNTVRGLSRNNIIVGSNNEIESGVKNTNVFGVKALSTADNSIVLGGNAGQDNLGERQSIQLMYGVQTTTSGTVDSYLNNVTGSYFKIPDNTVMYFNAEIVAVRVGSSGEGATGNLGDYASFVERGVVINKSGTLSINRERDAIKSSGTVTLWRPTATVDGTNFVIDIRGAANVTIEWAANITFTQIKTGVTL